MTSYSNEIDARIIRWIVEYPEIKFDEPNCWLNQNLRMAGDDTEFDTYEEFVSELKSDNQVLFKFLLVYYFEQLGFDAYKECDRQRDKQCDKNVRCKIRKHAIAMIKSFNEVKPSNREDAEKWFKRFEDVYAENFQNQKYSKKLRQDNFRELCEFYLKPEGGGLSGLEQLRMKIMKNKIEEAFRLLRNLKGIGNKVAKFILRDLTFYLTNWGKSVKTDCHPRDLNYEYAIPVDRWVRRISLSIPLIKYKVFELMQDEDLDKYISKAIEKVCLELKLNPLRFDFGAYLIGSEFEKKHHSKTLKFNDIYEKLKSLSSK